jgi:hypothetical protein
MRAVKFGIPGAGAAYWYTFPEFQPQFAHNFANVVPATVRLPALSGGFDELGEAPAPSEIGRVTTSFVLTADSRSEMEAKRDAVKAMVGWGVGRLYVQPSDPALAQRWCTARVNNVGIPERPDEHTDLFQRVTVDWQVSDPRWYALGTETWKWGDGTPWGQSKWGGAVPQVAASGLVTFFTITTLGSALTRPRITIACATGQTALNPKIQRGIGPTVVDEVAWTGTLNAGDSLEINCRGWTVKKNGADAYSSSFAFLHPDWMRLLPGLNALAVVLGNSGNACSVTLRYYEAFL